MSKCNYLGFHFALRMCYCCLYISNLKTGHAEIYVDMAGCQQILEMIEVQNIR